jgi:hypothetical protein
MRPGSRVPAPLHAPLRRQALQHGPGLPQWQPLVHARHHAIGTKSQKAENMGPMGKTNMYYDYSKDPSYAKEITLHFDFTAKPAATKAVRKR